MTTAADRRAGTGRQGPPGERDPYGLTGIGAAPRPYWTDAVPAPEPRPALTEDTAAGLAVVGGGYTGLWTALHARLRHPGLDVVLLEQDSCGGAASGRNGGFVSPSLTHGLANGADRWPREIAALQRLGARNLAGIGRELDEHGIDAGFRMPGKVSVASTPWEEEWLRAAARQERAHGEEAVLLKGAELAAYVDSPKYTLGLYLPHYALVDPARLVLGLREACLRLGVRIYEQTPVLGLTTRGEAGSRVRLATPYGDVRAKRAALATNAFRPLLRRLRLSTVPVYDYAITTEPLGGEQLAAVGWTGDHGLTTAGNQFHYIRKTADDRILFGGYDAVYHYGSPVSEALTRRPETFRRLAAQFAEAFPALSGAGFSHAWGGVIDSSTRFTMFTGSAAGGRVAYALGFTGLGVGATRFAALTLLDRLEGRRTERTELAMMRRAPVPFPPEPVRWIGVEATRWSMAREDATGRRNLWLKAMDRLGLGFDS